MAGFSLQDMLLKRVMEQMPVGQMLILFGTGGMIVFAILAYRRGEAIFASGILSPILALRSVCEIAGHVFFFNALALTTLSSVSAVLQATPLFVTIGAILFFKERVGLHRWVAILMGFFGVMLILRPGLEGFELASLFAVLGTLGFAGRDLGSRATPIAVSNIQLGVYGFLMLIIAGIVALSITGSVTIPDERSILHLITAILIGSLAYNFLSLAMRCGDVSVVAPFRYVRLVFAMGLGFVVFAERPDNLTLLGGTIIVASGLYTLSRSNKA
ncbi:DMT family transporter [Cohaesibacter celericrescens]|uniref:DMT family transporter n=1 Tax=Cohaesibacter celericrescens TaxID=2067669 RepID=UPI00356360DE